MGKKGYTAELVTTTPVSNILDHTGATGSKLKEHWPARKARDLIDPEIWASYEKIACIRNPYTWVKSFYRQSGVKRYWNEDNKASFSVFLENLTMTEFYWYTDKNGKFILDRLFKMEEMKKELAKYGADVMVHINKTRSPRKAELTEEDIKIVKHKFAKELRYYPDYQPIQKSNHPLQ